MGKNRAQREAQRECRRQLLLKKEAERLKKEKKERRAAKRKQIIATLKSVWKFIGVIGIILGIASGYVTFKHNISVTSIESLDPTNPFRTPFSISNDGYLDVYSVEVVSSINRIYYDNPTIDISQVTTSDRGYAKVGDIPAHSKATVLCRTDNAIFIAGTVGQITGIDMAIVISYQPVFFIPWRTEKRFRFVTGRGADKQLHWYSQPLKE